MKTEKQLLKEHEEQLITEAVEQDAYLDLIREDLDEKMK